MTLAYEDDNSKLVEVVTVAHVDDENRVDNSLVQIWKMKFGQSLVLGPNVSSQICNKLLPT